MRPNKLTFYVMVHIFDGNCMDKLSTSECNKLVRFREFDPGKEGSQGDLSINSPEAAVLFYLYFIRHCELSTDQPEASCNTFFSDNPSSWYFYMEKFLAWDWKSRAWSIWLKFPSTIWTNFPASIHMLSSRHVHNWHSLLNHLMSIYSAHRRPQMHTSTHVTACRQDRFLNPLETCTTKSCS